MNKSQTHTLMKLLLWYSHEYLNTWIATAISGTRPFCTRLCNLLKVPLSIWSRGLATLTYSIHYIPWEVFLWWATGPAEAYFTYPQPEERKSALGRVLCKQWKKALLLAVLLEAYFAHGDLASVIIKCNTFVSKYTL